MSTALFAVSKAIEVASNSLYAISRVVYTHASKIEEKEKSFFKSVSVILLATGCWLWKKGEAN